jgi:drug/metabolite transporter (DMT)-like permease
VTVTTTAQAGRPARLSTQATGILLVLVSACAFGSVALFVKPLYAAGLATLVLLAWRFTTAALVSWGYLLASSRTRRSLRFLTRRRVAVLLLLGTLYVGNSFTYIGALQVVPISLNSIIAYLYPAIVAVMALRLVRRLEGRRAWLALMISTIGIALALGGIPEGEMPPLWGLVLAFANPVIYATWIVFQSRMAGDRPFRPAEPPGGATASSDPGRPAAPGEQTGGAAAPLELPPADAETATDIPDPAAAGALMTTATAVVFVVLALASGASLSPADVPAEAWLPLLGLGIVATALAIQTFYAGVKRVGAARASLISTVEPVYTIALAMILFGERLQPVQMLGGLLVLGAVILAETGRPAQSAAQAQSAAPAQSAPPAPTLTDRVAPSSASEGRA